MIDLDTVPAGEWAWPNFRADEFRCRCGCGAARMRRETLHSLQVLRTALGKPLAVTSGYRCPAHNAAVSSTGRTGPHTTGQAVDIAAAFSFALDLAVTARRLGFTGIGLKQHGPHAARFVHLDDLDGGSRPTVWTYP